MKNCFNTFLNDEVTKKNVSISTISLATEITYDRVYGLLKRGFKPSEREILVLCSYFGQSDHCLDFLKCYYPKRNFEKSPYAPINFEFSKEKIARLAAHPKFHYIIRNAATKKGITEQEIEQNCGKAGIMNMVFLLNKKVLKREGNVIKCVIENFEPEKEYSHEISRLDMDYASSDDNCFSISASLGEKEIGRVQRILDSAISEVKNIIEKTKSYDGKRFGINFSLIDYNILSEA